MLKKLDPILHNELRLAIISVLIVQETAGFVELKEQTGASSGNLSIQISKLEDAGYLNVNKGYRGKVPLTECKITKVGVEAFEKYVTSINAYLHNK